MKELKDIRTHDVMTRSDELLHESVTALNEAVRELQGRVAFSDKTNGIVHEGDEPFERSFTVAELREKHKEWIRYANATPGYKKFYDWLEGQS